MIDRTNALISKVKLRAWWLALSLICLPLEAAYAGYQTWSEVLTPTQGTSDAIGSYANGCLVGGKSLALSGDGYQVIRSNRNRYYGHTSMIRYLTDLANKTQRLGVGQLLVGDIAMPRGGRFTSGHTSHQTGLDADIWLRLPLAPLEANQLQDPTPYPVVDIKNYRFKEDKWTDNHSLLLQLAADDPRVARIFVHPLIKNKLCEQEWKQRDWLRKVRPWWGHYYHFHVRLNCPENSSECIEQAVPPKGDGCGAELASWRPTAKPKTAVDKPKVKVVKKSPPKQSKPTYPTCIALLSTP
ncbi:penicillin-insensitive murein endopeptidase [Vibrio hippocampi]|nr:penicillin-insensitive murein endopeptidase [Vibrio hippocampi]